MTLLARVSGYGLGRGGLTPGEKVAGLLKARRLALSVSVHAQRRRLT
jgi:hypothetical protein